jgi:hypothetical protein
LVAEVSDDLQRPPNASTYEASFPVSVADSSPRAMRETRDCETCIRWASSGLVDMLRLAYLGEPVRPNPGILGAPSLRAC